jgi:hypothetical protein
LTIKSKLKPSVALFDGPKITISSVPPAAVSTVPPSAAIGSTSLSIKAPGTGVRVPLNTSGSKPALNTLPVGAEANANKLFSDSPTVSPTPTSTVATVPRTTGPPPTIRRIPPIAISYIPPNAQTCLVPLTTVCISAAIAINFFLFET